MTDTTDKPTVLVTGASGFLGLHCVLELLKREYRVRGTLRTMSREAELRGVLGEHLEDTGIPLDERMTFVSADLGQDKGWDDAVAGCQYVLHVASPLPDKLPRHEDELIVPARDGTLRVLRAASSAGSVKRVVMTSSVAAVLYGHKRDGSETYDESHWSDIEKDIPPYHKSKTIAERAAWDFVESLSEEGRMELAVINPGLILGPLLSPSYSTSGEVIKKLMGREIPGCPNLGFAPVDVRDVAEAHILAMTNERAAGQRFLCALEHTWMRDIAVILKQRYAGQGYRIPTRRLPNFVVRLAALFDKTLRLATDSLGKREDISNERIKRVLGWQPRSVEDMVVAMADSMIRYGVV